MIEDRRRAGFSRRGFLGIGGAAFGAAALLSAAEAAAQGQRGVPPTGDRKTSDPGPANQALDAQNPDSILPPSSDAGSVQTFKYPFSLAHKRLRSGGWSREVTIRELAMATTIAGVDMRLTAGGVRELHWHTAGEWAIMLYGNARITAIDSDGRSFVADVTEGDLWYFPTGIPHSIQGLNPDGAEFLLVFDDGNFSEYATVLLSDWMAHTPRGVLAKNFGVSEQALEKMPKEELFIFQTDVPGPLAEDQRVAAGTLGPSARDFAFRTMEQPVTKRMKGGEVRIVDSNNFKASTTIAAAIDAKDWASMLLRMYLRWCERRGYKTEVIDFQAGDVGYIQKTLPHYVENTGDTDLKFLEMFKSSYYQDLALSEWLTHTPPELVAAHLNIDKATLDAIPKDEVVILPR